MLIRDMWLRSQAIEGSGGEGAPSSGAASAPESVPQTTSPENSSGGPSQDVIDILNYDPFEQTTETRPAETPPVVAPEPAPPVQEPPVQPQATPESELAAAARALQETAAALPDAVKAATTPAAPATAEPDPWVPLADGQPVNYVAVMSQVPDAIVNGLASENPTERKQAVANLAGVVMHITQRQAVQQAVQMVRQEMSQVLPRFVNEQLKTYDTMKSVYSDFYGKYPQLAHPHIKPIVQREAAALSQAMGVNGWTTEFRDRLGERVTALLRQSIPVTAAPPTAPSTPTTGASVRPPMGNGAMDTQQAQIAELLGF